MKLLRARRKRLRPERQTTPQRHHSALAVLTVLVCLLCAPALSSASSAAEWTAAYSRLQKNISDKYPDPRGNPPWLQPYIDVLYDKKPDRDEAERLYQEAVAALEDGESSEARRWAADFWALADLAQVSGEQTTERAMSHMKIEGQGWENAVFNAQRLRALFLAARETRFASERVRTFAHCMMRYASRDIECSESGVGLYSGCTGPLDDIVDQTDGLSFNERCPKRQMPFEKETPWLPCDVGLDRAEEVREEARWWEFWSEHSQVTDAMVDYYKDVLCAFPADKGHRWYEAEAEEHSLGEALDHNQGFYATIKGRVTIKGGDEPARHVTVKITAPKDEETWRTETDDAGNYEIEGVLLHKTCSPFDVETTKWCGTLEDQFDGPLEEPDPGYIHEEDFEARPELQGELEFDHRFRRVTGQTVVNIRTSGRFPFRVDFEQDPPEIEGSGSATVNGHGTGGTCTFSYITSRTVELKGTLHELPNGTGTLRFEVTDQGTGPFVVKMKCPWPHSSFSTQHRPEPKRKYRLELEVVDGRSLEWDNPYGSGRYRAVLHVPCTTTK